MYRMATTNKALTTYLPTASVEWLERYCLDYKHLLNKEGNPKLGTALADIVLRLADGELDLPVKLEPVSTVIDPEMYRAGISELKSEIEGLTESLSELETYTHNQFKTIREELQQAVITKRSPK
jgi:hypothetical protein